MGDIIIAPQLTQLKVEMPKDLNGDDYADSLFGGAVPRFVSEWLKNQNCTLSKAPFSVIEHSLLATSLLLGVMESHHESAGHCKDNYPISLSFLLGSVLGPR